MEIPPAAVQFFGGIVLGITLAAPPGPVMAIMANEAARGRTRTSMVTAFGAMTGDAVWLGLVAIGFLVLLQHVPLLIGLLGLGGAALLLFMAWGTWRAARGGIAETDARGGYAVGFLAVLASPFSFGWWFANGAILLVTWGAVGIAGLFLGLVAYTVAFTYGVAWLGGRVKRLAEIVAYASAVSLAGFALWFAWRAVAYL